jgi:sulfur carrier protein
VGTAVNAQFVPRARRAEHALQDGDAVFTFAPITGG